MIPHISPSSFSTWSKCPEQWRRAYLEGDRRPPGIAARIGGGVHHGAEVNHKAKLRTGQDEPLDVVTDAARDHYVRLVRKGVFFPADEVSSAKRQIAEGIDRTVSLARLYHAELAPRITRPVLVEEPVYVRPEGLPVPVMGLIDVADESGWVPDLKTGARKWSDSNLSQHVPQMVVYRELYRERFGRPPARMSFEVLVSTQTPAHQSVAVDLTEGDWPALLDRFRLMLRMVETGIFPPAAPGHWVCSPKYCGYWWSCEFIPPHKKVRPCAPPQGQGGQK